MYGFVGCLIAANELSWDGRSLLPPPNITEKGKTAVANLRKINIYCSMVAEIVVGQAREKKSVLIFFIRMTSSSTRGDLNRDFVLFPSLFLERHDRVSPPPLNKPQEVPTIGSLASQSRASRRELTDHSPFFPSSFSPSIIPPIASISWSLLARSLPPCVCMCVSSNPNIDGLIAVTAAAAAAAGLVGGHSFVCSRVRNQIVGTVPVS